MTNYVGFSQKSENKSFFQNQKQNRKKNKKQNKNNNIKIATIL